MRSGILKLSLVAAVLTGSVFAQSDASQQNKTGRAGTFAIVGARIITVSGAVIENGTVVIKDGKIASVSPGTSGDLPLLEIITL